MEGKYIYGISAVSEGASFDSFAADGTGGRVYMFPYKDISAVLSDTEIIDFSILPKDAAVERLLRHQRVIEGVMAALHTILPMRLGTYAVSAGDVEDILSAGYEKFKEALGKTGGKIEIDVAATWHDMGSTVGRLGDFPEIKSLKEKLMLNAEGASQNDRIKIGMAVKKTLEMETERVKIEIDGVLGALAVDSRAHGLMDETMILNAAYLLDREKLPKFEEAVDALDDKFGGEADFRCVGPLPAYSFYTIEVKKIYSDEIEKSKNMLRLNGTVTEAGLKKAYRNMAWSTHPDGHDGGGHKDELPFGEINDAYRLLLGCIMDGGRGVLPPPASGQRESIIVRVSDGR